MERKGSQINIGPGWKADLVGYDQLRHEQGLSYSKYQKLATEYPHFTSIPKQYWVDNPILGTKRYINRKLGFQDTHTLTVKEQLKACIMFPEVSAVQIPIIY